MKISKVTNYYNAIGTAKICVDARSLDSDSKQET